MRDMVEQINEMKITRVELIDDSGRAYVNRNCEEVKLAVQDEGRTLKVFVGGVREYETTIEFHTDEDWDIDMPIVSCCKIGPVTDMDNYCSKCGRRIIRENKN